MRSDATPALDPSIAPNWTGQHIFGAGIIQRNGTIGQVLELDRSYIDSSNHSEFKLSVTSTNAAFTLTGAGSGASTLTAYSFDHGLLFATDNSYDIGAASTNRPRNVYAAQNLSAQNVNVTGQVFIGVNSNYFYSRSNGVLQLSDFTGDGFSDILIGNNNSSGMDLSRDAVNSFAIKSAAISSTFNDPITAASGTVANRYTLGIAAPIYTATNTAVTYTTAETLYIGGAPTASTNVTIGTAYALNVASGVTNLGGGIQAAALPTSDPHIAGRLYSSAGVVMISAG